MNKPREGNVPGLKTLHREIPSPEYTGPGIVRVIESGLAEPVRDTARNRRLAKDNGWTEKEYLHWVDTGDPPIRGVVKQTPAVKLDENDDERLHQ